MKPGYFRGILKGKQIGHPVEMSIDYIWGLPACWLAYVTVLSNELMRNPVGFERPNCPGRIRLVSFTAGSGLHRRTPVTHCL